jgi:oligoribonuclease NrnB/cAMP/cGMP phosphodiesterase (DHH superfamily)
MNVFIFSHIADADGITPIILSKLAFLNVDYKLLDNPIDEEFLKTLNKTDFSKYDYVFMTDLCIAEDTVKKLNSEFLKKFKIFDHHISNINMNKYDFIDVIDEENGIKQSGTSLFYNYLCKHFENELLNKKVTKNIVEIVRLADTWSWEKENKNQDSSLTDFLSIMGIDEYINYFYNFILNNEEFYLEEKLKFLFDVELKRKQDYINEKDKQLIKCYIKPYKVGVVFAESYRSLLGNSLAKRHKNLDFIIIINLSRSISYRGINNVDLSKFASLYGGKGHINASGSPLPSNLKEHIIKEIFKGADIIEK